jgi:acyl transferase domain-containing protein/3-hydroxymyristoyl/3-hydroxydecanoyl-(acyl carrier protein) dehydratase
MLAKALGLGGGSFTLDAACASSLYALKLAADELLSGRTDAMLTGGLSRPDCLYTQMGFSQLRALSPSGRASPFDAQADGLVVGEGCGIFVLKRLTDALRDHDHVYATIAGIGLSNDIEGNLLAPSSEGQLRAMRAAYRQAGWQPEDVDVIECHATGTQVGDAVEFASLRSLWKDRPAEPHQCAIGSVKSNIGHALTAAGAAGLLKVLLAMKYETRPPSANFTRPNPQISYQDSPFQVLSQPQPWQRRGDDQPRRAAVSGFGFGGINAHVLLEEWIEPAPARGGSRETSVAPATEVWRLPLPEIAIVGMAAHIGPWPSLQAFQERVFGGEQREPQPPTNWWGFDGSKFPGYYLSEIVFPRHRFRIPPKEVEEMLPQQLLMLLVAADAIRDAKLPVELGEDTGVFIGIGLDLNTTNFSFRWSLLNRAREWNQENALSLSEPELHAWTNRLRDAAGPPLSANRTMGALGGIVASRIARMFRVGGPSFTVSSEETSGISALSVAVRMLQRGDLKQAVVGAVDLAGDVRAVLATHAGQPFSAAAGEVPSDGATALILKQRDDALRDGDRIYAVIKGVGAACAGGADQLIPTADAYRTSLLRALSDAGVPLSSISYFETHGSGCPAEDKMESAALQKVFDGDKALRPLALGAAKGDIGHTGAAAGLAGLVKTALCLHQEMLPPSNNCAMLERVVANTTAYRPLESQYWLRNRAEGPRRGAVSCFSVDGNCAHAVLDGPPVAARSRSGPTLKTGTLFAVEGGDVADLVSKLHQLRSQLDKCSNLDLDSLGKRWWQSYPNDPAQALGLALVARNHAELREQIATAVRHLQAAPDKLFEWSDSVFFSPQPLGNTGGLAFVFPGSGNHFPGMGRDLSARWPAIWQRQDSQNEYLRNQIVPDRFWNQTVVPPDTDHRKLIQGQVTLGAAVSDLLASFDIRPDAAIGYSLGESAALFALRAWTDRDEMFRRLSASSLFNTDLAGPCNAARRAWNVGEHETVAWLAGVVACSPVRARAALSGRKRVYLLIINTPSECVIGGDRTAVEKLIKDLGCSFIPLTGVSTVHCEIAKHVAGAYHDLHVLPTTPPPGVRFYSGAWGRSFEVNRESAADAILAQALDTLDFPRLFEQAYADGIRVFLEVGPGASCSRIIDQILGDRPHLARPACIGEKDAVSQILRLVANLIAERVPVTLENLYDWGGDTDSKVNETLTVAADGIRVKVGGEPFAPPAPPRVSVGLTSTGAARVAERPVTSAASPVVAQWYAAEAAKTDAHAAYLRFAESTQQIMAEQLALQMSLAASAPASVPAVSLLQQPSSETGIRPFLSRDQCLEFAVGSIANVLGPEFAGIDAHPTRVRLPDEPLMLVDRILCVEGEPRSLQSGRVVTEHDIHSNAWYLDNGRIPTCIAVEAGQADLFLSGYLGVDLVTKGLAVYRLLDAVVTFHRSLPEAGEVIHYDIRIERFFRQDQTHLFRFSFEGTVNGEPLLSMRDGCAGFFTAEELAAGKGVVHTELDRRTQKGAQPADWEPLVPMKQESLSDRQIDALRSGDIAGSFGPLFQGLSLQEPMRLPGGKMRLIDRVTELDPQGGRFGLGRIRAEADIHPADWFLTCHFVDDQVMPGTLMYECCMHSLRVFLMRMGWVGEQSEVVCEPVPEVASRLKCRGQVIAATKKATYEVVIKEIGYRPEPYVLADALMYADGKPIVEITNMSLRMSGLNRERLEAIWRNRSVAELARVPAASGSLATSATSFAKRQPAIFDHDRILAFAVGKPSEAFGEPYRIFDHDRVIARLPGPPYQFLDRITSIAAEPWKMVAGGVIEADYDVPPDAWYWAANRQEQMPFAVLLEIALQPCGWLAAYLGSALTSDIDMSFRNLGGQATLFAEVTPDIGTLTTTVKITKVSSSGGMIIQNYDFTVRSGDRLVYQGDTYFGFFSKAALAQQVGIREARPYDPTTEEKSRARAFEFPSASPCPDRQLRMIDHVDRFLPEGGPHGLGFIEGRKRVDSEEWFFQAHFYQDPVCPGSLGLESFLQLLKVAAVQLWGASPVPRFPTILLAKRHRWTYRGQVIPPNQWITVQAAITARDDASRTLQADGFLLVDGRAIYQMNDFAINFTTD